MSQPKEQLVYASPREVALKIAALHGEQPVTISVNMIGADEVESFVRDVVAANEKAATVSLPLD